jgi:alpha-tubulin suppressor-like RCC1 family protein
VISLGRSLKGNGTKTNQLRPVSVVENVSAISAGDVHSLFLRKDGSVWGTGSNRFRHLGDALLEVQPRDRHVISPYRIMDGVSSAFAGRNHDSWFVMRDGSVLALGNNEQYKLGFMGDVSAGKPIKISFLRRPPAEIKERQETGDKPLRRFNPEVDMPILTKPPRNAVTK